MEPLLLIVSLVALAVAERIPAIRFQPVAFLRPFFVSDVIYLLTGAVLLNLAMRSWAVSRADVLGIGSLLSPRLPCPVVTLLAVVLYDLGAFLSHLLLHRVGPLWELHKVHHSSPVLDWLATFRGHILEHALRHLASPVALLLLGFPAWAVATAAVAYGGWAAFGHSNLRLNLRILEPLLITPRLHRLHHVPTTSQKNFGTIFSLWDRWLGTLEVELSGPLHPIGVPDEVDTYPQGWFRQLVQPARSLLLGGAARN